MRDIKINHIGLAVPSIADFLEKNAPFYGGFSRGPLVANPTQRVNEMFITDGATVIELLEPGDEESPINGFLKRNRFGGLIHVAFDVDDLDAWVQKIETAGGKTIVSPTPDTAFQNRRIAFVILNGQVTELIERAATPPQAVDDQKQPAPRARWSTWSTSLPLLSVTVVAALVALLLMITAVTPPAVLYREF